MTSDSPKTIGEAKNLIEINEKDEEPTTLTLHTAGFDARFQTQINQDTVGKTTWITSSVSKAVVMIIHHVNNFFELIIFFVPVIG
ncbi:5274_t:CDS:2 [Ambispora gerdemannii]|uniref:5274_t:CDS:1 n=1 Tax=Ambispora gerdemannii TaxID=144530 RepID=A0A9N9GVJ8_9GLOM|nr:5274_t:CDS:2 [Ambispora gerdemannii]